jgi:anti-sigma regulatory factor (Ser/Thr protein kinase)
MSDAPLYTVLLADAAAPGAARRFIRSVAGLPVDRADDIQLLVSELVSNSVRHGPPGQQPIDVCVSVSPDTLRIEVENDGDGFEPPAADPARTMSGFGLYLTDKLSDRWGVAGRDRTLVWFEIDIQRGP